MKKISVLIIAMALVFNTAFAFGVNSQASGEAETDNGNGSVKVQTQTQTQTKTEAKVKVLNKLDNFDAEADAKLKASLKTKEETKGNVVCTMKYSPVCGKLKDGSEKTFSNACFAKTNGAKIEYKGECKTKKAVKFEGGFNTGITGGVKGVKNQVPMPNVKVKAEVKANGEGKENKEQNQEKFQFGVQMNNGDGNANVQVKMMGNGGKDQDKYVAEVKHFSLNLSGNGEVKGNGQVSAELKRGIFVKPGLVLTAQSSNDGEAKIVLDGDKYQAEVEVDGDAQLKVENGKIRIGNSEVNLSVDEAVEKAQSSVEGEDVIDTKLEVDADGKAYYNVKVKKKAKLFGFIDMDTENEIKVDASTGGVVEVDEPWYSFLLF